MDQNHNYAGLTATEANVIAGRTSTADDRTPGSRTIEQMNKSLEQLEHTVESLGMSLCPVLRHAEPEKAASGEVREAGQSPVHQTLIDMLSRIQRATQSLSTMRNRVTL